MYRILFMLLLMCAGLQLRAQDSAKVNELRIIAGDSVKVKAPKSKFQPNPTRALVYSLVIPGAGQIYNRDWWKIPLVYGAIGGVGYFVQINYKEYKRYNTARNLLLEGKPHEFSAYNPSEGSLKAARDYYRSNFELSCLGLGLIYALQAIEAYTAAHLKSFDISDNLSFKPYIENSGNGTYIGMSYSYPLKQAAVSPKIQPKF